MTPEELTTSLPERLPDLMLECSVDKGHAVALLPDVQHLPDLMQFLRDDTNFRCDLFIDLTAVDWLGRKPRFDVVYHLRSTVHKHRLRVKVRVDDGEPVPTSARLWPIADWMEREVWDLYGVKFSGHPNLKRLLLYEEFRGHPLRKDYPYDKRQPLIPETWPSRESQVRMDEAAKIHRR